MELKLIRNRLIFTGSLSLLSFCFFQSGTELLRASTFQWNDVRASVVDKIPTNNGQYYKGITTNEIKGYFEGNDRRKAYGILNYILFATTGTLALLIFIGYFDYEPALALIPIESKDTEVENKNEVAVPPTIIRDSKKAEAPVVEQPNPFVLTPDLENIVEAPKTVVEEDEIFESDEEEEEDTDEINLEDDELQEIRKKLDSICNESLIDRIVDHKSHMLNASRTGGGKTTIATHSILGLAKKYYEPSL